MYVKNGNKLLKTILKQIPGLTTAYLLLSKGKLIQGDIEGALSNVAKVLEMDPRNEECNMLSAMIEMRNSNIGAAYQYIESALSEDFTIRENPLFMLLKGQIELKLKENEKALASLK